MWSMVEQETSAQPPLPGSTRPRLTAEERRRSIVDAARTEFARVGYHGASTASIAERAGCSEPMLYKHFTGKHELFLASLRDSIERYQAWFDSTIGADERSNASAIARSVVDAQMQEPEFLDLLRLRMLAVSLADDAEVRETLVQLDRATQRRIELLVARGIEQGVVDPATDPRYVAWAWVGFMLAACYRDALEPGTFGDMSRLVGTFIESLAPRSARDRA